MVSFLPCLWIEPITDPTIPDHYFKMENNKQDIKDLQSDDDTRMRAAYVLNIQIRAKQIKNLRQTADHLEWEAMLYQKKILNLNKGERNVNTTY